MNRFIALFVGLVWLAASARAEDALTGKFHKLDGAALLNTPAGVELGDITIAKTPSAVELYVFPDLPAAPKALWSAWGDGCLASDGRYYTGIGNHLDYDGGTGESRVYVFDPKTKSVKQVVNVRDVVPDARYAAGKIHARIDQGHDGLIYFATYWGKNPEKSSAKTRESFIGSALLRYDPATGKTELLGPLVEKQGVPTSITDAKRMIWYGYAEYTGDFFAYDLEKRAIKFRGGGDEQGNRNIMLDKNGNAYFGRSDGTLGRYDPETNKVTPTKAKLPEVAATGKKGGGGPGALRASTQIGADGVIYAMTHGGRMFSFDPAADVIADLGDNWPGGQYVAVMERSPDGRFVYYAPGAHGGGSRIGSPVVQYDVRSKQKKVIAFLNPASREQLKYNVGGTYNLKVSPDGSEIYVTFNGMSIASGPQKLETFGMPSIAVISIAKEER